MKVSELIAELEDVLKESGDVPVMMMTDERDDFCELMLSSLYERGGKEVMIIIEGKIPYE